MMLADWFGAGFDILKAPTVPYGYLQYLFFRYSVEAKEKELRQMREAAAQANAMNGNRGRRAM